MSENGVNTRRTRIIEVKAKSIMVTSKLPDTDVVINPYTGCAFGCAYCYASFMGRFVGEPISAWGDYVYVKTNAVELVRAELARLSASNRQRSVLLSSVTDPYQGAEVKYRLTRGILEELALDHYPGRVSILTKSPVVTRDIDVLGQIANAEVGVTVTTTEDDLGRALEVRAPSASRRLRTLTELTSAGIGTYVFVGPLLPHFVERPDLLDELFARIAQTGVTEIYVEQLNLSRYIQEGLNPLLRASPASFTTPYTNAATVEHKMRMCELVDGLTAKHRLHLRLGAVLDHRLDRETPAAADGSS